MEHPVDLFVSDQYQFTTSYTYFISKKHQQVATFQIFFRKHPFKGQFALCAGINAVKEFYKTLTIKEEQIKFLKNKFPHMCQQYFEWLRKNVNPQNIKVKSFKEGQVIFAKEPIITYTGPLSLVQLLETPTLNLLGFATLVTTNAFRMVRAANLKKCAQMGLRRAQGPDGGLSASQYSYLGGFTGTSNLQASLIFDIPCIGTMSHAFVTSFTTLQQAKDFQCDGKDIVASAIQIRKKLGFKTHDGELASFLMYAKAFQNSLVALIDTYSTLTSGLLNTIVVAKALHQIGVQEVGVRLDSGNLCSYSKSCRQIWNKYAPEVKLNIIASDDLNEDRILEMQSNKSQIDIYGIGTNIATCQKQPALGLVCKLVELDNKPKMKFSQTVQKATYPSKKSIYRIWAKDQQKSSFDLITLQNQQIADKIVAVDSANHLIKYEVEIKKKLLLNQYWNVQDKISSVKENRIYLQESARQINDSIFHLTKPSQHPVLISEAYLQVLQKTIQKNIVLRRFD